MSPLLSIFPRWRRFSSIVRTDLTKTCAALLGLIVCAAMQDLSPTILGVKPPFLLIFGCFAGIPTAVGAGLFTDALGGLPFGCSAVFYAVTALLARLLKAMAMAVAILAAVVYQLWVALWSDGGNTMCSLSGAAITAVLLSPLAFAVVQTVRRRIGLDTEKEAQ